MNKLARKFKRFIRRITYKYSISKYSVNIMTMENTIKYIIDKKVSVSRLGDGEFRWILMNDPGNTFEDNSKDLSNNLIEVIKTNNSQLLVCLPDVYSGLNKYKLDVEDFWNREISRDLKNYYKYINPNILYGNSFFSRPYISYKDRDFDSVFKLIKNIWNERELLIVEGQKTRFGVGNDLLTNANHIDRLLVPTTNAYTKIDTIYSYINKYIEEKNNSESILILMAIGPTATILAKRISDDGKVQAIDIGHLDIEYEWYLRKSQNKESIPGKYVNESVDNKFIDSTIADVQYISQIWADIS